MKICFFGAYDRSYTSNILILQGINENNIPVVEINAFIKVTAMNKKEDMSKIKLVKRLFQKTKIFPTVLFNIKKIRESDFMYIGFPGHIDIFLAWPLAKLFGKKIIFNPILIISKVFTEEVNNISKKSIIAKIIKLLEKKSYQVSDMVLADTYFQKSLLINEFGVDPKKIQVLPLGADNKGYEYSEYKNTKSKKINVVYYGLYSPVHGVNYIVEAARILKNDNDVSFTFIGNGPSYKESYTSAKNYGLKNIKFYPDIREGDHLELVQNADMFIGFLQKHPSVDRIIPNKVYQGLALGRTVLTADSPVIRSVFTHKDNIYLVKPSDAKSLADAITELKNRPELRSKIAANGYKLYKKEFNPKAVGAKLKKYLEEII